MSQTSLKDICLTKPNETLVLKRAGTDKSKSLMCTLIYSDQIGWNGVNNLSDYMCDNKHTVLYIDTPGGNIDAAISFRNRVKLREQKLTCIVTKECCSAGLIILATAEKRIAVREARFVFHSMCWQGPKDEQVVNNINRYICKIFASVSKYSADDWFTLMDGHNYEFTAEQLYETGFITEIREQKQEQDNKPTELNNADNSTMRVISGKAILPLAIIVAFTGLFVWIRKS